MEPPMFGESARSAHGGDGPGRVLLPPRRPRLSPESIGHYLPLSRGIYRTVARIHPSGVRYGCQGNRTIGCHCHPPPPQPGIFVAERCHRTRTTCRRGNEIIPWRLRTPTSHRSDRVPELEPRFRSTAVAAV